jgi:hypothetical protein
MEQEVELTPVYVVSWALPTTAKTMSPTSESFHLLNIVLLWFFVVMASCKDACRRGIRSRCSIKSDE